MNKIGIIYQLVLADFRERTRRYSYLITMLGVLFFGYLVITGKYTIRLGNYRPVYDSVWAGSIMAVSGALILSLVGFYLVRGSIKRDRITRVGQILAAAPISRMTYIFSKFLSNVAALWSMIGILALAAFITLIFRNETGSIDLWGFVAPFLIISFPAMTFVAAVAVLFENIRWLSGSLGNIIYLFAAEFFILYGILNATNTDLTGASVFMNSVRSAAQAAFPNEKFGFIMGFVMFDQMMQYDATEIFNWSGITWTGRFLIQRISWISVGLVITITASRFFDRFDPAKAVRKIKSVKRKPDTIKDMTERSTGRNLAYSNIAIPKIKFSFVNMIAAELRLALKGYHWSWYLIMLGLIVAQVAAPFEVARLYLVPGAMVWPIIIWSSMGTREKLFNTSALLFSSPHPVGRQFPSVWLSGVLIALTAVSGIIIKGLILGQFEYLGALIIGIVFVPCMALFLGSVSGSKKLFEVLYLMIWYTGSIDKLHQIDLLAVTGESIAFAKLLIIMILALGFMVISFVFRGRRVTRE